MNKTQKIIFIGAGFCISVIVIAILAASIVPTIVPISLKKALNLSISPTTKPNSQESGTAKPQPTMKPSNFTDKKCFLTATLPDNMKTLSDEGKFTSVNWVLRTGDTITGKVHQHLVEVMYPNPEKVPGFGSFSSIGMACYTVNKSETTANYVPKKMVQDLFGSDWQAFEATTIQKWGKTVVKFKIKTKGYTPAEDQYGFVESGTAVRISYKTAETEKLDQEQTAIIDSFVFKK